MEKGVAIFRLNEEELLRHEFPLDDRERLREHIQAAYDEFRKRCPDISLFDGVLVIFDKA